MTETDPVQLALLIRRGQLKLTDVSQDQRNLVFGILNTLTDAQAQTILCRGERRYRARSHAGQSR